MQPRFWEKEFRSGTIDDSHGIKVPSLWLWETHASYKPLFMDFLAKRPMHGHQVCILRVKWPLGGQIYSFDALRHIIIDCIVLDEEGLSESLG